MPRSDPDALRVTTFNVLHDSVRNPLPRWPTRRPRAMETLRALEADVLCLQEVSPRQLEDFAQDLPEYEVLAGEETGGTTLAGWATLTRVPARFMLGEFFDRGERCPILLRRGVGRRVDTGCVRLEAHRTDFSTPHLVNWARIELSKGRTVGVYNTHLALVRGRTPGAARHLLELLDARWSGGVQILAGDFNARPTGAVLRTLTNPREHGPPSFVDTWCRSERRADGGTFHWGLSLPGPRLDYILVRPSCDVASVTVSRSRNGGSEPSDHYAVTAELRL